MDNKLTSRDVVAASPTKRCDQHTKTHLNAQKSNTGYLQNEFRKFGQDLDSVGSRPAVSK